MKIEVGKFYRTRYGERVGFTVNEHNEKYPLYGSNLRAYTGDGSEFHHRTSENDIIAEWTETPEVVTSSAIQGPVREVTRKEIVPGVYGKVRVKSWNSGKVVRVIVDELSADELTDAISTLTHIRDALEEAK